jgi:hypothetical protein
VSLIARFRLSQYEPWKARTAMAAAQVATAVLGEDTSGPPPQTPAQIAKRQGFAHTVLLDVQNVAEGIARAVLTNPTIAATVDAALPPDEPYTEAQLDAASDAVAEADILFALASLWNDLAGVTTPEIGV